MCTAPSIISGASTISFIRDVLFGGYWLIPILSSDIRVFYQTFDDDVQLKILTFSAFPPFVTLLNLVCVVPASSCIQTFRHACIFNAAAFLATLFDGSPPTGDIYISPEMQIIHTASMSVSRRIYVAFCTAQLSMSYLSMRYFVITPWLRLSQSLPQNAHGIVRPADQWDWALSIVHLHC